MSEMIPPTPHEPEHIEPDLIGQLDLLDQIFQSARAFRPLARNRIGIHVSKCVETEFHIAHPVLSAWT